MNTGCVELAVFGSYLQAFAIFLQVRLVIGNDGLFPFVADLAVGASGCWPRHRNAMTRTSKTPSAAKGRGK